VLNVGAHALYKFSKNVARWSFLEAVCLHWYLELLVLLVLFELFVQYEDDNSFQCTYFAMNTSSHWSFYNKPPFLNLVL